MPRPSRQSAPGSPRVLLAVLLAGLALSAAAGTARCKDGWICLDEVRAGDAVEIYARNLRSFPVTYTLNVRAGAGARGGTATVTDTLAPLETQRAAVLPASGYSLDVDWAIGDMDANHDDDHLYAFPYEEGRAWPVLQGYGSRFSHRGLEEYAVDFNMPEGTPVHAARTGIVARVVESNQRGCWEVGCGRYANYIVVLHSDGTTGEYYHLKHDGAFVEEGETVARGQRIGLSGNTGHSAMPHLHFAVYRATNGGRTQSIPVRFQSVDGIVNTPRRGSRHAAAY